MIKDRPLKKMATKLCASQGIIPFVEVLVRSPTGLEDAASDITDIDVLGYDIGKAGSTIRTIFDCKTASKMSAINRALWAAGLTQFVGADRAFVIQKKETPYSHKLAAHSLHVSIHSEAAFERYARSISPRFDKDVTYLDNMDVWDAFISARRNNSQLTDLIAYTTTQSALESQGPKAIRICLAAIKKSASELDPAKQFHRTLFGLTVSSFLIALSLSAISLIEIFQFSMPKEDFEKTVRYFVWEGRDNYDVRVNLKNAMERARGESGVSPPFDLPEWQQFITMMRSLLDAPEALAGLPHLAKEVAFRSSQTTRAEPDARLRQLFQANNRARQFIFSSASYLVKAGALPKEFGSEFEREINDLISATPTLL